METLEFPIKKNINILAMGAESAGIFAVYQNGIFFVSRNFGDLLDENNLLRYKKAIMAFLQKRKIRPDIILADMHPLYNSAIFGAGLALRLGSGQAQKKCSASRRKIIKLIKVQHHIAHIFSAVGDHIMLQPKTHNLQSDFFGLAMDGTGYGLDGNIWGGEILKISNDKFQMTNQIQNPKSKINAKNSNLNIERIGSLEEQMMIGGDLAVREPARMLIAILAKIKDQKPNTKTTDQIFKTVQTKENIYHFVKKYYTRNEFEALYSQMEQGFNCQKTTSTGRVLDAASVLLGFAGNERNYKHEAVKKLEENSTEPYNFEPRIKSTPTFLFKRRRQNPLHISSKRGINPSQPPFVKGGVKINFPLCKGGLRGILETTPLFEYLIKNIKRDKKRLAATAQLYIAKGLCQIIKPSAISHKPYVIFAAGGMVNNKIISSYLEKQGAYLAKKIPRGDEGVAIGQIVYCLLSKDQTYN